ncbi:MAG: hypothetical protein HY657_04860 [Acidobacteria bacterium]|nr:hypothetical protein [Acidobacteriota bacterium]
MPVAIRKTTPALWPAAVAFTLWCGWPVAAHAQRGRQGGGAPPASAQQAAPIDLTGYWVSIVSEDWRWRMITPPRAEYTSVPLNDAGRKMADAWDPARDVRTGNACRPFGVGGIMRLPGRIHITWENTNTLRVEMDAGTQTRLLHFGTPPPARERTWQGQSVATWEVVGGGGRGRGAAHGSLTVVTTMMRSGYLRWNGVPYSEQTTVTEYFDRHAAFDQEWITVTTMVDDPVYLTQPFITTSHFRREPDGSTWTPAPCETAPPPVASAG